MRLRFRVVIGIVARSLHRVTTKSRSRSMTSALTRRLEASSIAIDVSASQFPQLPVPRHSPEQVGAYRATNAWLERYPLRQHKDLQEYAQDRLPGGQKNYLTVSRDPRHRL